MLIPGPAQLGMIALIVALVFGTKKLRAVGGDIGGMFKGIKDGFREASTAADELAPEVREAIADVKNLHAKGAEFTGRALTRQEEDRRFGQPHYGHLMDEVDEEAAAERGETYR